jgi:hypothetical protein
MSLDSLWLRFDDYLTGWTKRSAGSGIRVPIDLPRENCIQLVLAEAARLTLRPSGTEPKLKLYVAVRAGIQLTRLRRRADAIVTTAMRILPISQERTMIEGGYERAGLPAHSEQDK